MRAESTHFRQSSIQDVTKMLYGEGISVDIFEPLLSAETFEGDPLVGKLDVFKGMGGLIMQIATARLWKMLQTRYTRDLFASLRMEYEKIDSKI